MNAGWPRFTLITLFIFFTLCGSLRAATPLPDTGQTKFYNNTGEISEPAPGEPFYGQDALYTRDRSYTKLDSDGSDLSDSATEWYMVRDNVTRLIWEVKKFKDDVKNYNNPNDADNLYTWYDSNSTTNGGYAGTPGEGTDTEDFIDALNVGSGYCGYTDWRLPTVKELSTLVDTGRHCPGIDETFFPETRQDYYWSSTNSSLSNDIVCYAWNVHFTNGKVLYLSKSGDSFQGDDGKHFVRAVRGGNPQSALVFIDNNDGTVTDPNNGLMWQQSELGSMKWQEALSYCERLELAGYDDWRLPDVRELQSLINYSGTHLNETFFPGVLRSDYWSSSTHAIYPSWAWRVSFSEDYFDFYGTCKDCFVFGLVSARSKKNSYCVRAVRTIQSEASGDLTISSFTASPVRGDAPVLVNFECKASCPECGKLKYRWDFENDGQVDRVTSVGTVNHRYLKAGNYVAVCEVVAENKASIRGTVTVEVSKPSLPSGVPDNLTLDIEVSGNRVQLSWHADNADGYKVYQSPYPEGDSVHNFLTTEESRTITFSVSQGWYISFQAYNDAGWSELSERKSFYITVPPAGGNTLLGELQNKDQADAMLKRLEEAIAYLEENFEDIDKCRGFNDHEMCETYIQYFVSYDIYEFIGLVDVSEALELLGNYSYGGLWGYNSKSGLERYEGLLDRLLLLLRKMTRMPEYYMRIMANIKDLEPTQRYEIDDPSPIYEKSLSILKYSTKTPPGLSTEIYFPGDCYYIDTNFNFALGAYYLLHSCKQYKSNGVQLRTKILDLEDYADSLSGAERRQAFHELALAMKCGIVTELLQCPLIASDIAFTHSYEMVKFFADNNEKASLFVKNIEDDFKILTDGLYTAWDSDYNLAFLSMMVNPVLAAGIDVWSDRNDRVAIRKIYEKFADWSEDYLEFIKNSTQPYGLYDIGYLYRLKEKGWSLFYNDDFALRGYIPTEAKNYIEILVKKMKYYREQSQ